MISPTFPPLSVAAASRRCCRSLTLTYCVRYAVQWTVTDTTIPRLILWEVCFFVVHYFAWDWDWYIGDNIVILLSKTPFEFSCPIRLRLYSSVSTVAFLLVTHIWFHHYPPLPLSLLCASLLLSPSSCLSVTSLLLLYWPFRLSATISSVIPIHHPYHIPCTILL